MHHVLRTLLIVFPLLQGSPLRCQCRLVLSPGGRHRGRSGGQVVPVVQVLTRALDSNIFKYFLNILC